MDIQSASSWKTCALYAKQLFRGWSLNLRFLGEIYSRMGPVIGLWRNDKFILSGEINSRCGNPIRRFHITVDYANNKPPRGLKGCSLYSRFVVTNFTSLKANYSRHLSRDLNKSHLIPKIRLFKRCKSVTLSRVLGRAQVPVLKRDSDSPYCIVWVNRNSGIRCYLFKSRIKTRLKCFDWTARSTLNECTSNRDLEIGSV